jgi:hypothetical protein
MRGARTGVVLVFGAALGLLFGQMLFDGWWLGSMIGVAAGLVIGAVADLFGPRERLRRGDSGEDET